MAKVKLGKKHQDAIKSSLRQLHDIGPEIARAKSAGIDTTEHEQMHADSMQRLLALHNTYGEQMGQ